MFNCIPRLLPDSLSHALVGLNWQFSFVTSKSQRHRTDWVQFRAGQIYY